MNEGSVLKQDAGTTWDPEVLARIAHLHLVAREAVAGFQHGDHRSIRVAPNVEFADYKEYSSGDNLRDLDWKVLARSDRLVVRRHQAEAELATTLVVDASADMGTGESQSQTGRPPLQGTKFGFAACLAATLAYFLFLRGEPVGLALIGGRGAPFTNIAPRGGRGHLAQVFAALASVVPAGTARLHEGFLGIGPRIHRRSMVVVISDFMEEPERWGPSLMALARRKADLRAVHVHDRRELSLDYREALRFVSPETGQELPVDAPGARKAFTEVVEEYLAQVRGQLAARKVHTVFASSDDPLDRTLARLIGGGR